MGKALATSLLPRPSDDELLRIANERMGKILTHQIDTQSERGFEILRAVSEANGGVTVAQPYGIQVPTYRNAPKRGRMNKTEAAYAEQLDRLKAIGHVHEWRYGALSLRLADRTWYRPDFLVETVAAVEIHEVKGHWEDDARVKFKVAAELYPMFRFLAVRRVRGEFSIIETLNGEG